MNQIARSSSSFKLDTKKKILEYVCTVGHGDLMFAKDNDGDIPLHSAVRSKADQDTVYLFATACNHTQTVLMTRNKKIQTPLELAFELCHWPGVEELLTLSIQNNESTYLTGVYAGVPQSKTFLHEAFESGHTDYFRILLDVCKYLEISKTVVMAAIRLGDARGNTAWYYLMSRNKYSEIEQVLSLLGKYQIDINELYTDTQTYSSLLHEASRIHDKECIALLKKYNATESIDSRGVKPYQRIHQLVFESSEPGYSPISKKEIPTIDRDFLKEYFEPRIQKQKVEDYVEPSSGYEVEFAKDSVKPVDSVKDLVRHLEDIGNLEMLCVNLNLGVAIINDIINSRENADIKRLRCFQAYFDSGHATWEEVIAAVLGPHIHNKRVAKTIGKKYNIDVPD